MMTMLQQLKTEGQQATSAIFVHDHNNGWKLFAENSFFVQQGDEISAFLSETEAKTFADRIGAKPSTFRGLQDQYA